MSELPDNFTTRYAAGEAQIITRTLPADLETPVSAALKLLSNEDYSFLLESVEGGAIRGRYSFLGWAPDLIWSCSKGIAALAHGPFETTPCFQALETPALQSLQETIDAAKVSHLGGITAPIAGLVGNLGYDMVRLIEDLPQRRPDYSDLPDSMLIRPTMLAVFDSVFDTLTLAAIIRTAPGVSADAAHQQASLKLQAAEAALSGAVPKQKEHPATVDIAEPVSNTPTVDYLKMVDTAKDYIGAGDIFQVVLSQRFSMPFPLSGFELYRSLRRTNPSPFLFHLHFGEADLIGSSPEILVRVRDGEVTIRPIAGTRPRGRTDAEDAQNAADLLADKKECAEHLMLLDLGRNDVGRVTRGGSVAVTQSFEIERYSHVMHIVSNVVGCIKPDETTVSALFAGFPAGTVSGAPKVRAMEIIDELEKEGRGPYAGAVGYFGASGDLDSCIVLRTALLYKGTLHIQAGGGIVADSSPRSEHEECVHKAKAIVSAAQSALRNAQRRNAPYDS
ncbi:MAG: anthranilate synthase component I [Pseudomonadota bacterium]